MIFRQLIQVFNSQTSIFFIKISYSVHGNIAHSRNCVNHVSTNNIGNTVEYIRYNTNSTKGFTHSTKTRSTFPSLPPEFLRNAVHLIHISTRFPFNTECAAIWMQCAMMHVLIQTLLICTYTYIGMFITLLLFLNP